MLSVCYLFVISLLRVETNLSNVILRREGEKKVRKEGIKRGEEVREKSNQLCCCQLLSLSFINVFFLFICYGASQVVVVRLI